MHIKKKRTIVMAAVIYLIMTLGSWMFLNSYANSYNHLSDDKITAAAMVLNKDKASLQILEHTIELDIRWLMPESKFYCGAYILSPDELRSMAYLISFCYNIGMHTIIEAV